MIKLSALFCISLLAMLPVLASCTGDSSTSEIEQRNKEIIQQAHASLQAGDIDGYKSLISPNYIRHCQAMPPDLQEIHGTEKFFGFIEEFMKAVPVYTDPLSNMIAEGDKVAYVSTLIGTMTGPIPGGQVNRTSDGQGRSLEEQQPASPLVRLGDAGDRTQTQEGVWVPASAETPPGARNVRASQGGVNKKGSR